MKMFPTAARTCNMNLRNSRFQKSRFRSRLHTVSGSTPVMPVCAPPAWGSHLPAFCSWSGAVRSTEQLKTVWQSHFPLADIRCLTGAAEIKLFFLSFWIKMENRSLQMCILKRIRNPGVFSNTRSIIGQIELTAFLNWGSNNMNTITRFRIMQLSAYKYIVRISIQMMRLQIC